MRYLKYFEKVIGLEKGDYVYCQVDSKSYLADEINNFLIKNIGQFSYKTDNSFHKLPADYIVDFKDIPKTYSELNLPRGFKMSIGSNWKSFYFVFKENDIKFYSKNKEEVLDYMKFIDDVNKYNL